MPLDKLPYVKKMCVTRTSVRMYFMTREEQVHDTNSCHTSPHHIQHHSVRRYLLKLAAMSRTPS